MYSNKPFTEDQIIGRIFLCTNEQRFIPAESVQPTKHFVEYVDRFGSTHFAKDKYLCPCCRQLLDFGVHSSQIRLVVRY